MRGASVSVGQIWPTNNFGDIEVIEYRNNKEVVVKFLESGHVQTSNAAAIRKKYVKDMSFFCAEGVVERLKVAHDGKNYDYSLVEYKGSNTPVKVICPEHGVWESTPHNLLKPQGCPTCGKLSGKLTNKELAKKRRKFTRESYIEASKKLFGERFSYENLEQDIYLEENVTITCPDHGDFQTERLNHLRGNGGCQICNPTRIKTHNEYIISAIQKHGDKFEYEYSESAVGKDELVNITCKKHEAFKTSFNNHIAKSFGGCFHCAKDAGMRGVALSQDEFISRCIEKHNGRYNYSLVEYINGSSKVKIICPVHGVFEQTAENHLSGKGCRECSPRRTMTDQEWLSRAKDMHGDRYDYSKSKYTRMKDKITITCKQHGDFKQAAWNHLVGIGCPSCGASGFTTMDNGQVYLLQSDECFKIGITNNPVEKRVRDLNQEAPAPFKVLKTYSFTGDLCLEYETQLHRIFKRIGYKQPVKKFDGYTECFHYSNICEVIDIVDKFMKDKQTT